jgi:NAD+ diphosphatase
VTEPVLSRATVDRDSAGREGDLAAAWEAARVLVVDSQGQAAVDGTDLLLVDAASAPEGERYYLGKDDEATYFAVVSEDLPRRLGTRPMNLRDVGAVLSDRDAGLMVHAVGLAHWHRSHPCCPRCGAPTEPVKGGSVRRCAEDGSEHFPRTDPAIIVLVTDGADRAVLGRQHVWPERRFSTLAGFVEPGESLEQAVVREVREESSLHVRDVSYRGSQPWPFPASLMLGFRAVADADAEPAVGDDELAEVRWFTRDQLRTAGPWEGGPTDVLLPPPVSIAHALITEWVAEG